MAVAEQIWIQHDGMSDSHGLGPTEWVMFRLVDGSSGHARVKDLEWDYIRCRDGAQCVAAYFPSAMPPVTPTVVRQYRDKPIPTGVEAEVCELIAKRQQVGIAKYRTTVADNPLSLRQWLQHALEEVLDQAVYLKRAINEIDKQGDDLK